MQHVLLTVAALASLAAPAAAQIHPTRPIGVRQPMVHDSGWVANPADHAAVVYHDRVRVPGASWLRLYFGEVVLERGSMVVIRSALDGQVQELDAAALAAWGRTSAYFNGDAVTVELLAAAGSAGNRIVLREVARERAGEATGGCAFPCGICGNDDRVPSDELFAARLLPAGCSATVYNEHSCMVSAGHCVQEFQDDSVVQFNVPDSNADCSINHPPVADQFPVTALHFENGGIGADWAAMTAGANPLGQTPFERYGVMRPIATTPPVSGNLLAAWGYGVDNQCDRSQRQQAAAGSLTSVAGLHFRHNVDISCGVSGASMIRDGEILGIQTHCPCSNYATRVDHPSFEAARAVICGAATHPLLATGLSLSDPSAGFDTLLRINFATAKIQTVGPIGAGGVKDIAVDAASGLAYALGLPGAGGDQRVYVVDPSSGAGQPLPEPTGAAPLYGLAFGADGRLFGAGLGLYEIDTATGAATLVAGLEALPALILGLAGDSGGGFTSTGVLLIPGFELPFVARHDANGAVFDGALLEGASAQLVMMDLGRGPDQNLYGLAWPLPVLAGRGSAPAAPRGPGPPAAGVSFDSVRRKPYTKASAAVAGQILDRALRAATTGGSAVTLVQLRLDSLGLTIEPVGPLAGALPLGLGGSLLE